MATLHVPAGAKKYFSSQSAGQKKSKHDSGQYVPNKV